jgi:hypothetical protein
VDYQSFGAVARLLVVASMIVTVISNYWRHGDIDLTGRYANMRKLYGRAMLLGVVVAALARLNVFAMLRTAPAFDSVLTFYGIDLIDDAIGVLFTGVVIGFLSKWWNDFFDLLYELKRFVRGKANALRADDMPRSMREGREMRRGRRGSRGRGMGGSGGMGGERGERDRGERGGDRDRSNDRDRQAEREGRRPDFSREPFGGNP